MVDKNNFSLMITSTFFPMLDILSDYLNLITATWAAELLFHLAWPSICISNVVLFVYELGKLKVQPRVLGCQMFWLRNIRGVPGYFDKPLLDIAFYDDILKLLTLFVCWIVSFCFSGTVCRHCRISVCAHFSVCSFHAIRGHDSLRD